MGRVIRYIQRLEKRIQDNKNLFILYTVLRLLVIATMMRMAYIRNYEGVIICVCSLIIFLIPGFVAEKYEIEIPPLFEGTVYLMCYVAEIIGEVDHMYVKIQGMDTVLHIMTGFLSAAVGLSLFDLSNRHFPKFHLSPLYLVTVAFCFSMTVGVIWEFIECAGDYAFGQDMQKDFIVQNFQSVTLDPAGNQTVIPVKNITETLITTASGETFIIEGGYLDIGRTDTMKDLFGNFVGAVIYCLFSLLYLIQRAENLQSFVIHIMRGLMWHAVNKENILVDDSQGYENTEHIYKI